MDTCIWVVCNSCGSKNEQQKNMCSKGMGLCARTMLSNLGSTVNMDLGLGGPTWPLNERENLHFGKEWDNHTKFENDCRCDLDSLITAHWLCESCHMRSGYKVITLLNVQLLFCGPLEYNIGMLKKLRKETDIQTKLTTSHCYVTRTHAAE